MISVEYSDISLTAKSDMTVTATDKTSFSNLNLLKLNGVEFKKFATLEKNLWLLDGTFENFPDSPSSQNFALWSETLSDANGEFATPLEIILNFSAYETSAGLTFNFSTKTNDYPTEIQIVWYKDANVLETETYTSDSSIYFAENTVVDFNKIVIKINKMNKSYRRFKLEGIVFGTVRTWNDEDLRNLEILDEISLTSEEISINTMNLTMNNTQLVEYSFQQKQPISVYRNGYLLGTYFISKATRKSETLYDINAVDYIGILEQMNFAAKTYNNELVSTIIADIMGEVPYTLDTIIGNKRLTGTIDNCSCREALLNVAFATCSVVDTSRSYMVNISQKPSVVSSNVSEGLYEGMTFEQNDSVTEIQIVLNDENETIKSKKNPQALTYSNILQFSSCFVGESNYQEVLNYLYDYYVTNHNNMTSTKFIVNNEKVGDVIEYSTEYLGTKKGQITQMKFNLNSGKYVASVELKDLEV